MSIKNSSFRIIIRRKFTNDLAWSQMWLAPGATHRKSRDFDDKYTGTQLGLAYVSTLLAFAGPFILIIQTIFDLKRSTETTDLGVVHLWAKDRK